MFDFLTREKKIVEITNLNNLYITTGAQVREAVTGVKQSYKRYRNKKRCFVIEFNGDLMASGAKALSHEVTAVICGASDGDEVLVKVTSPGGAAHAYGYAASQLERFRKAGIPLTVSVDKVAASGGYMMACVADKIIAAPYAIIGSIGVVSEFPNFFDLLQKWGIQYKQYTAGKYKRTVSPLGEITDEGESKFKEDLGRMYELFKSHVARNRPEIDNIDDVATGEHWQAIEAIEHGLVDEIKTAEEFILENMRDYEFAQVTYIGDRKTWAEKLGAQMVDAVSNRLLKLAQTFMANYLYMT